MTNDLSQAVQGVYNSSREIMKNKQRHLYINMLDLLTRTTRASGVSVTMYLRDDHVKFWYTEVLPLVFDEDRSIQDNAVTALETVLPYLEGTEFHNLPEWPVIKAIIVDQYSKKLHDLRQASNSNWYKIWCLLVRILNKEILKGATVINTFLSIVELGFRSSDYNIRADAFLCWKVLVEIFAKHNEIFAPKRIKLICIPLKSSQSKTLETSVNKFKVWWYFLTKLSPRIEEYLDIYESFLVYCFGPACKLQTTAANTSLNAASAAQGKAYTKVKQMAIACLIQSMGRSTKEVDLILNSMGLEHLSHRLITKNVMSKCGPSIVNACFEATLMACDPECKFGKQIEVLWKNFSELLALARNSDLYYESFRQLTIITKCENFGVYNVLQQAFSMIVDELTRIKEIPFEDESSVNVARLSEAVGQLLETTISSQSIISNDSFNNLSEIFSLKNLVQSPKFWMVEKTLISFIMSNDMIGRDFKVALWRGITTSLTDYLKQNLFEFRIIENAKIVNEWIMWPFKSGLKGDVVCTTESFLLNCKNLIEAASYAEGKSYFTEQLTTFLKNIYDDMPNTVFIPIFGHFITSMNSDFDMSSKPSTTFELINRVLANSHKYNKGSCTTIVQALSTYISTLRENQILISFTDWKTIFATMLEKENTGAFSKQSIENFKRTFQDKLKSEKAKERKLLKEIKDLLKTDSQYVIIPTVWSMNPDKLTDHQKEKMKEKRMDIPAMYNDISQSQDTSIKPWTPKKIVIAKSKDSDGEIVIENNIEDRDSPILITENEIDHQSELASEAIVTSTTTNDMESPKTINDVSSETSMENQIPDESSTESKKSKSTKKTRKGKKEKKSKVSEEKIKLLDKLNIKLEKKNVSLLRELKTIEIDTVEGNTVVQSRFRDRRPINLAEDAKNKQKQQNTEKPNATLKRKRTDGKVMNAESTKKKPSKPSKKSLEFGTANDDKANDQTEEMKLVNGNAKSSDESTDEVIEASQKSESVLPKKISARKSMSASTNNNTILTPTNKNSAEKPTVQTQQNSSLSPQKENSSPNIDETIAETPTMQENVKSSTLDKTSPSEKDQNQMKETSLTEVETQPKTELMNTSINSSFSKLKNTSADTSLTKNISNAVQTPISIINNISATTSAVASNLLKPSAVQSEILLPQDVSMSEIDTQPKSLNDNKNSSGLETNCAIVNAIMSAQTQKSSERQEEPTEEITINDDKHNSSVSEMNCSIRSSPESKDTEERNSEFLNNTLNISPISNDVNKEPEVRQNYSEQEKLTSSPTGKKLIKPGLHLPISPPERKPTNNAESPATRPKHIPQLTGRGAQLINMIRNRRTDTTPKPQVSLLMTAKTDEKPSEQTNNQPIHPQPVQQNLSPPKKDHPTISSTPQPMAPPPSSTVPHKDLLVFSKILPSPYASPSASILKRKIHRDSLDEIESPASKRKRVSFHDPPVSLTKEYVKDSAEHHGDKPNLNRCLLPDRTSTPNSMVKNNALKRKGRADSIMEIANYNDADDQSSRNNLNRSAQTGQTSVEMDSLKWNNTSAENGQVEVDERCLTPSPSIYFANEEAVFKHIMEKYPLEALFEKYTEGDKTLTNKSIRNMTNKLCTLMKQDPKIKTNVLEILSEQHPREVLDHAVQENLSFVVCERLNYNSIVEFVCEKSKLNEDCRRTLLERIQSLLNMDKLSGDAQQLMMSLLKNHRMSSEEIVKCLKLITDRHAENQEMSVES